MAGFPQNAGSMNLCWLYMIHDSVIIVMMVFVGLLIFLIIQSETGLKRKLKYHWPKTKPKLKYHWPYIRRKLALCYYKLKVMIVMHYF